MLVKLGEAVGASSREVRVTSTLMLNAVIVNISKCFWVH